MKIGMKEIYVALNEVALQKLKNSLEKEGFSVELNYMVQIESKQFELDLYAFKENERRIYEIKIGSNKIQKSQFLLLQEIAKALDSKLFITYLELPRTKVIEYSYIDLMIWDYLSDNFPSELDSLSTHTTIDSVDSVDLTSIKIDNDKSIVEGNATLNVNLQYGSNSDINNGFGDEMEDAFDFYFRLKIVDNEIKNAYFKFDLEHFYE